MNKKISAYAILAITFLFPFRYAYLTPTDTGKLSLCYFLLVVLGTIIFTVVLFSAERDKK